MNRTTRTHKSLAKEMGDALWWLPRWSGWLSNVPIGPWNVDERMEMSRIQYLGKMHMVMAEWMLPQKVKRYSVPSIMIHGQRPWKLLFCTWLSAESWKLKSVLNAECWMLNILNAGRQRARASYVSSYGDIGESIHVSHEDRWEQLIDSLSFLQNLAKCQCD